MFDPAVVAAILAFAGIGVTGLTEMIKRFLHWDGTLAYIISAVVSMGATAYTLLQTHTFGWIQFIVYSLLVFLEANGIYKFVKK